eukprot:Nk52_evm25s265 gene=Nk52_evmTU25s265
MFSPHTRKKSLQLGGNARLQKLSKRNSFAGLQHVNTEKPDVRLLSPRDLAEQCTIADYRVFRPVLENELVNCNWNAKGKTDKAPNVVNCIHRFNRVSYWVISEILERETAKERSEVLAQFLRTARELLDLNNFSSSFAIFSGLRSVPIHRLKKTWALLSKRENGIFKDLKYLFSEESNSQNLRNELDSRGLPCIPYLGLYLTDITFVYNLGKEGQQERLNIILKQIRRFQNSNYGFLTENEGVLGYLLSFSYFDELGNIMDENNYQLSLKREPKENSNISTHREGGLFKSASLEPLNSSIKIPSLIPIRSQTNSPCTARRTSSETVSNSASSNDGISSAATDSSFGSRRSFEQDIFGSIPSSIGSQRSNSIANIDYHTSSIYNTEDCEIPITMVPRGKACRRQQSLLDDSFDLPSAESDSEENTSDSSSYKYSYHRRCQSLRKLSCTEESILLSIAVLGNQSTASERTISSTTSRSTTSMVSSGQISNQSNLGTSDEGINLESGTISYGDGNGCTKKADIHCSGIIKRKCITFNGKKCVIKRKRKLWTVLLDTLLVFYKKKKKGSERTSFKGKVFQTLSIRDCEVQEVEGKLGKKNSFGILTPENSYYVFTAETEKMCKLWINSIRKAQQSLREIRYASFKELTKTKILLRII